MMPNMATANSNSRHRRLWRIGLIAAAVILILAAVLIWHQHAATAAATAAARRAAAAGITITSVTAETGDINVYLNAIGTVTPVFTDSITSQVSGPVTAVNFQEGQLVHKGDALIEIDAASVPRHAAAGAGNSRARPERAGPGADGP